MTSTEERTATPNPARRWSRRRIVLTSVIGGILLLVAAAWIVYSAIRITVEPEDTVREYLDLLASGDAAAASTTVDPTSYTAYDEYSGEGLDTPVVTSGAPVTSADDIVLDAATIEAAAAGSSGHLVVGDLRADDDGYHLAVGDRLDVDVEYTVADVDSRATLRVERLPDTWYGFPQWRVVDPLLVPMRLETNLPELGAASIGSAPIDVSGPRLDGAPQRATLLYPGVYTIQPAASEFVVADDQEVTVAEGNVVGSSSDELGEVVDSAVVYTATDALEARVSSEAEAFVTACFASLPEVGPECPTSLRLRADFAQDIAISDLPILEGITTYSVDYAGGAPTEPPLRATFTPGRFTYTADGLPDTTRFSLYAWISPTSYDDVAIEFRSGL
ncbi:hypothetical protein NY547_11405 [Cnuibacter physcomitrellae]|uniref:hypothetical protein n=1 Tax=Cnuibacter physcomitrellae TaxID=1619308 RepID=UPI0021757AC4|nr:hypothetical protein [Cnuibacter physcomitrellae]MCS5497843.1 hypothetical protein [Cnuibacter physcomitrellae]